MNRPPSSVSCIRKQGLCLTALSYRTTMKVVVGLWWGAVGCWLLAFAFAFYFCFTPLTAQAYAPIIRQDNLQAANPRVTSKKVLFSIFHSSGIHPPATYEISTLDHPPQSSILQDHSPILSPPATTMASGTFFSPQKTLLLAPVVSSTCSLLFAWDQHIFLNLLTHPELSDRTNAILPTYWRVFFPRGLAQVVSFLGITTWTSIGAVVYHKALLQKRGALPWYVASATLAVAHLVFVPFVAPAIKYIMEDEGGRSRERKVAEPGNRNVDMQSKWLGYNMVRMLTTDLGAWVCCLVGVMKTFDVVE